MKGFDKLKKHLKSLADKFPTVIKLPIMTFLYIEDIDSRSDAGIDYCFEHDDIIARTQLTDSVLDCSDQDSIDDFYDNVVWNMSLDEYERELKYIANIDDDDMDEYVALLVRKNDTFEIEIVKR